MPNEPQDPWSPGDRSAAAPGEWPADTDQEDDWPERLSTGRWTSPSLGAYDPSDRHEALAPGGEAEESYFRDFGYGEAHGDGRLDRDYRPETDRVATPNAYPAPVGRSGSVDGVAEPAHRQPSPFTGQTVGGDDHDPVDDLHDADDLDDADELDEIEARAESRRNVIEWAVVLVGAVLLALVLRTLVLQAFWIPSPSMESTLLVRDRVLVNKLSYRLHDVHRGDVVVFRRTDAEIASNPELPHDVIKRVIALGGETIEIRDNQVLIDGQLLQEPYLDEGVTMADFGPEDVPEGHVFVMGDNRELSLDSRFETGPVAEDRVVGRAFFLFWPLDRMGSL